MGASRVHWVVDALSWIVVVGVLLRVEHLWASTFWVNRRGREFSEALRDLKPRQQARTAAIADILRDTGGGNLPHLFMGIKAYKLENMIVRLEARRARLKVRCVQLVRLVWRYYVLPLVLAPAITALAITEIGQPIRLQLLLTSWLLLIGFIAIAAEGYLANHRMGSWATSYHRLPKHHDHSTGPDPVQEGAFRYGIPLVFVLPCALAAISTTGSLFGGYETYPEDRSARFRFGIDSGLGLIDFASNGSANYVGLTTNALVLLTAAAYVIVIFGASADGTRSQSGPRSS